MKTSRVLTTLVVVFLFLFPHASWSVAKAKVDADQLLEMAENIRNPVDDYSVNVTLIDSKGGKAETRTYETLIHGRSKALVRFLTPEVDKGTKVLMVDDQMWVYIPSSANAMRISARQKLTGNAAYGDVARLSFAGNYKASLLRIDEYQKHPALVLDLTAIDGRPVTYDRIEYWLDAKTKAPLKAFYETSSGKILREGYFLNYAKVLGVSRPTHLKLVDHLETAHETTLVFGSHQKSSLSDLLFERQNLGRD